MVNDESCLYQPNKLCLGREDECPKDCKLLVIHQCKNCEHRFKNCNSPGWCPGIQSVTECRLQNDK